MVDTPRHTFTDIEVSQSQKEVTHNESLQQMDAIIDGVFTDRDLSAAPALTSPADDGKTYIVKPTGTGAWAGQDNQIAYFRASGWTFYTPVKGQRFWVEDENIFIFYTGAVWLQEGEGASVARISIEDRGLTAPPGGETDGQAWIPAATATGDWAGHEDEIAVFRGGVWSFVTPIEGEILWIKDEDIFVKWSATAWEVIPYEELFQEAVIDRNLTAPPALTSPTNDGQTYIVGPSATGAWAAHDDEIAVFRLDAWIFYVPVEGWSFWLNDENLRVTFDSANWIEGTPNVLLNNRIKDRHLTAPPGGETDNDMYIPAATATGAWAGQEGKLAVFRGVTWRFFTPLEGWMFYCDDENTFLRYNGTVWGPLPFEVLLGKGIIDKDLTAPPGGETLGDLYIVAATATGAWAGQEDDIAYFNGLGWDFFTPAEGWRFWLNDENRIYTWTSVVWLVDAGEIGVLSYSFAGSDIVAGTYYFGGYYEAPAADSNLTQVGPTQTLGTANIAYGAHAFIVASGLGTSNKTTGVVELEVSGTSVNDQGVRVAVDTEIIVVDIETGFAANAYFETVKKWIGQVTFTLQATGDATTFSFDFNYGFAKYDDFANIDFTLRKMDLTGFCGAADSSFVLELLHHTATGWTYNAAAFVPGNGALVTLLGDYSTEDQLGLDIPFAWKRDNLSQVVAGAGAEGILFKVITSVTSAVRYLNANLGVTIP